MGNLIRKRKTDVDDQWRKQNEEASTNPCYKLANLDKTGVLIEAYRHGGAEAVAAVAIQKIGPWVYHDGRGVMLPHPVYEEWLKKYHAEECEEIDYRKLRQELPITTTEDAPSCFRPHPDVTMSNHAMCWDLQHRGAVGETALHLCFLLDTPIHREVARVLLSVYPLMVFDIYEGEEYYGESCLHLAIVYHDIASVKWLLSLGADVHQRASGRFFLPEDQKKRINYEKSNYEGFAYYGEYPLAFACSMGNETIYDILLRHGADPNAQDSYGNTVLHMAVIHDRKEMFTYASKHYFHKAELSVENKAGLTPLALSCKLGRGKIFEELIRLERAELWRYSNITATSHPLASLDTIGQDGKINEGSALMMIIDGKTDAHLEMLEGGVIRHLLEEKWRHYIRPRFYLRMVTLLCHVILISTAVYLRPHDRNVLRVDTHSIIRYICEIIICIDCIVMYALEIQEWRSVGFVRSFKNFRHIPSKFIFLLSCLLILLCIPCRFIATPDAVYIEETFLILAVPAAWAFFLFFAKGRVWSGPYITITYNMCANDIFRACIIYVVFLLQFSPVFYYLFKDAALPLGTGEFDTFATPWGSIMSLFKMTLGDFEYQEFNFARISVLLKIIFSLFMFVVPILLLNLLIASMGSTYQRIVEKADMEWRREWGRIILTMERGLTPSKLLDCQRRYCINFKDKVTGENTRSLMVVHASVKTRAQQRKMAIQNWQMLYEKIQDRIDKLRMWGHRGDLSSETVLGMQDSQVFAIETFHRSKSMYKDGTLDSLQFVNERESRVGSASMTSRERRRANRLHRENSAFSIKSFGRTDSPEEKLLPDIEEKADGKSLLSESQGNAPLPFDSSGSATGNFLDGAARNTQLEPIVEQRSDHKNGSMESLKKRMKKKKKKTRVGDSMSLGSSDGSLKESLPDNGVMGQNKDMSLPGTVVIWQNKDMSLPGTGVIGQEKDLSCHTSEDNCTAGEETPRIEQNNDREKTQATVINISPVQESCLEVTDMD